MMGIEVGKDWRESESVDQWNEDCTHNNDVVALQACTM